MSILSETFFTLVGRHFVSFVFFTVWHNTKNYKTELLEVVDE